MQSSTINCYWHYLCLYFLQSGATRKEENPANFHFTTMGSGTTPAPGTVPSPRGTVRHGAQPKHHQIGLQGSSSGATAEKDVQLKVAMY